MSSTHSTGSASPGLPGDGLRGGAVVEEGGIAQCGGEAVARNAVVRGSLTRRQLCIFFFLTTAPGAAARRATDCEPFSQSGAAGRGADFATSVDARQRATTSSLVRVSTEGRSLRDSPPRATWRRAFSPGRARKAERPCPSSPPRFPPRRSRPRSSAAPPTEIPGRFAGAWVPTPPRRANRTPAGSVGARRTRRGSRSSCARPRPRPRTPRVGSPSSSARTCCRSRTCARTRASSSRRTASWSTTDSSRAPVSPSASPCSSTSSPGPSLAEMPKTVILPGVPREMQCGLSGVLGCIMPITEQDLHLAVHRHRVPRGRPSARSPTWAHRSGSGPRARARGRTGSRRA